MQDKITKAFIPIKEIIFASIICLAMTVMDITVFPAALFINITVSDITPQIFTVMINQWIIIAISFLAIRFLCPQLFKQIGFTNIKSGFHSFWLPILILIIASALACSLGQIGSYNNTPSAEKIIVEGLVYYIGVGIIEELYIRALLLNIIERLAYKTKHATLIAIIVSSVLFGLGHIFGMIGQKALNIVCKVIFTIMLGIIFGVVYKKTNNLWLVAIAHVFVDFCGGLVFCFVSPVDYAVPTLIAIDVSYFAIALYLLWKYYLHKPKNEFSVE